LPPGEVPRWDVEDWRTPQLRCLNEKISRLAAIRPWADVYRSFSIAAQLAGDAVNAAEELQQMPGVNQQVLVPALAFWYRVRDFNHVAALNVVGGNQDLAEALVTFRLLQSFGPPEVPDGK
jgi:hypothetical protein